MRNAALVALLALAACDKLGSSGASSDPAASASATATATATATAAATAAAAATPTGGAAGAATIGSDKKGVLVNTDAGVKIVNDDKNKSVTLDGGQLTLNNSSGSGSVTQTDAGVVLKGKDGKTLTLPPVPGLK